MRRFLVGSIAFALLAAPAVVAQTPPRPKQTAKPAAKAKTTKEPAAVEPADAEAAANAEAAAIQATADAEAATEADRQRVLDEQRAAADADTARARAKPQATAPRGLQARLRVLAEALAISLKRLPGDHRDQRFAVLPFEAVGDETQQKSLGIVVADMLVTDLARDHRLPLVERAQLGTVMNELALQQSGAVADEQVLQVGKTAGARAVVVGRVSDAGEFFTVSARAVDAESGTVLAAEEAQLPKAELIAFSADAVVLRSRGGAAFRSTVVPGWGQSYNGEPVQAAVVAGIVGGLAVGTVSTAGLGWYFENQVYDRVGVDDDGDGDGDKTSAAEKSADAVEARTTANRFYTAAVILGGATVVAWGANIVEAWVTGTDVESLDAALAQQ